MLNLNLFNNKLINGKRFLSITVASLLFVGTAVTVFASNPFSVSDEGGDTVIRSHGEVKYTQDDKEVVIDSSDIKNLALAVNSVNRDVDTLKAGLENLLPQGENSDVSNIVGLITSGTATQDDVLEGMTFSSSVGIDRGGNIPRQDDIHVSSTDVTNYYNNADDTITVEIPKGYYDGKSVVLDVGKYNDTIYTKGYQEGLNNASVNITAKYNYHVHSLSQNNLTETASSFDNWQSAIAGLNDTPSQNRGGCYQTSKTHNHTGNSSNYGGCYTNDVTHHHSGTPGGSYQGTYYCGGCVKSSIYSGGNDTCRGHSKYVASGCYNTLYWEPTTIWQWEWTQTGESSWEWQQQPKKYNIARYTCYQSTAPTYALTCGYSQGQFLGYATNCGHSNGELLSVLLEY